MIVGYSASEPGEEAFLWSKKMGTRSLGDLPGGRHQSAAWSVSADGAIVVGWGSTELGRRTFRWTEKTGLVDLGALEGDLESEARDISDDGRTIVGASGDSVNRRGYVWRDGQTTAIQEGVIWGVATSADGRVIVGQGDFDWIPEPFLWTAETGAVPLHPDPDSSQASSAYGISADGRVVVGSQGGRAFQWSEVTGMRIIGPFYPQSLATDTSRDGSVVVGQLNRRAFIWTDDHGMRELGNALETDYDVALGGYTLFHALAISDDGRTITGSGYSPTGPETCWIVELPPACSDRQDNDGDAEIDLADLGCLTSEDDSEGLLIDIEIVRLPLRGDPGRSDRSNGRGHIRLAVLGSAVTDVRTVDPGSLMASTREGVPIADPERIRFRDGDGDGYEDLVAVFSRFESRISDGRRDSCLRGDLGSETFFGCDSSEQ
jgi:uncharacterized membrane protein